MEEKTIGPVLSEVEFYTLLDGKNPELAKIKKIAEGGDLEEAKAAFAKHVREGGYKEVFFENRDTVSSHRSRYKKETLLAEAARVLTGELKSVGITCKFGDEIDWFANPTYNGYREWTWQLSRHHDINILAKSYEETGEIKYAFGVVKLLTSWIRQAVRPEPDVRDGDTLCWRTIEVGERMSMWPGLFFPILDTPAATDEFILDFCRSVYEHGARLRRSKTLNNWRDIELAGFSSLVVLFPFFAVNDEWREHVAKSVCEHLLGTVHPDGFQFELTPGYHGVTLHEAIHSARTLGVSGYKMPPEFDAVVTKMFETYVLISQSGGIIPGVNDANVGRLSNALRDNEPWTSKLIEWAKAGCPEEGAPKRSTLVHFEYAGLVTMRDKWASPEFSLFFDAGKIGRSHQHEDKLNLLIFNNGKEILTEGHSYAYDTSDIRAYVLSTFSHNTVSVDGEGQARKKGYKWLDSMLTEKEPVVTFSSDCFDYAVGEYREAYGEGEKKVTDVVHKREIAFLKNERTVVVIDTLTADFEHTYEAMWHLDTEFARVDGNRVSCPDVNIFFGEKVGALTVVKGQTEPQVQGFVCRGTVQGDYEPIPTVLNTVFAKDAKMLTVFTFDKVLKSAVLEGKKVVLTYEDGTLETVQLP